MTERSILFSAPMVRAILAGKKTQTRRVIKPQPRHVDGGVPFGDAPAWARAEPGSMVMRCPYGKPGDRLWVREAHSLHNRYRNVWCSYRADDTHVAVPAPQLVDIARPGWRPSIHMPRWASRITLEVTGVRVERLQDISRGDAMAEGCPFANMAAGPDPCEWYRDLWEQINGAGSWDANPWVWCVSFRRVEATHG